MTKFLGFDTETVIEDNVHQFLSFQIYTEDFNINQASNGFISFDESDLLKFLTKKFHRAVFVCFNLNFDAIVVSRILKNKGFQVYANIAGSRMTRLTVRKGKMKWIFVDLKNILPIGTLEKVGELFNLPKLEKPINLGHIQRKEAESDLEFTLYALRDAEICFKAIKMIYDDFHFFRTTCAGMAIRVFKRDFCHIKKFPHYNEILEHKFRKSYHGGRTECFIRGTNLETVYGHDVISLYPFVMLEKDYPNICSRFQNKSDVDLDFEGIALATVKVDADFPPLCIKGMCKDGFEKLLFPNGTFKGYFAYPELRALENDGVGKIIKVNEAYEWKASFNPFKGYISNFYALKKEATANGSPLREFYKILLNSLYGKFGEKGKGKRLNFEGDQITQEEYSINKKKWYHNVILSSYITAYARLHLYDILKKLEPEKTFYCDTDSIYTSQNIYGMVGNTLGKLKCEGTATPYKAIFIRSKFYMFNDEIIMKGFSVQEDKNKLLMSIYGNNFSMYQHKILKVLEAKRVGKLPLTDTFLYKKFSCDDDGKRRYGKKLKSSDLINQCTNSIPLILK
ncbi:hypothetical protein MUP46_01190 [Patescibacteria group bacterium]|nr:hypothetical protein [Patescibacteria group bacterium]